jgi:arylsulfatase A-like enzyme
MLKRKKLFIVLFLSVLVIASVVLVIWKIKPNNNQQTGNNYNVVIFAFDALQAKHLNAYGYTGEQNTTPNLDKFFGESYRFQNTVSPSSWTVPTFMSIFTSLYPGEHKLTNKFVEAKTAGATTTALVPANLKQLDPQAVTIAEILKKNGYATGGFTGDSGVNGALGYNQGFDTYYDKEMFGGFAGSIPQATAWLDKNKDNKFFMFVHGYDVHGQYEPQGGFDYRYVKKPYTGKYTGSPKEQAALREEGLANGNLNLSQADVDFWRAIYDEKINRADAQFGGFMQHVEDLGLMKNTIFIVLSDHGTEFYEHKRFDHGHTLYGELVDVLLAIHTPNQQSGEAVKSLVSTLDVTPTILSLLHVQDQAMANMKGIDLTPSFSGTDVSRDIYSETDYRLYTHKRSIQTPDGWKFILTMENLSKELYNLNADPREQNNLAAKEPKIAYELEQKIYAHLNAMDSHGPWTLGCVPAYPGQCQNLNSTSSKKT